MRKISTENLEKIAKRHQKTNSYYDAKTMNWGYSKNYFAFVYTKYKTFLFRKNTSDNSFVFIKSFYKKGSYKV